MALHLVAGIDFPSQLPTATAPSLLLGLSTCGAWVLRRPPAGAQASSAPARPPSSSRATRAPTATSPSCTGPRAWSSRT